MAPTILVVGATGNTGKGVIDTLPGLLRNNTTAPRNRILALTRTKNGKSAQRIAKLPDVELLELNWTDISSEWLQEQDVKRVFIASHNEATQFADEGTFLTSCRTAGVEYVVRISTTSSNVRPDCLAYYPRTHWALETMLSTPEFAALQWTSLQPNVFHPYVLGTLVGFVQQHKKGGKGRPGVILSEDGATAPIDAAEVGVFAAHLLAESDVSRHNRKKYVLNGPEDITGKQVVGLVEQHTGEKLDAVYKDVYFVDQILKASPNQAKSVTLSLKHAPQPTWDGTAKASDTSQEVLDIYAPKVTAADALKAMLEELEF